MHSFIEAAMRPILTRYLFWRAVVATYSGSADGVYLPSQAVAPLYIYETCDKYSQFNNLFGDKYSGDSSTYGGSYGGSSGETSLSFSYHTYADRQL